MTTTKQQLKSWLAQPAPESDLVAQIRRSAATPLMLEMLRRARPQHYRAHHRTLTRLMVALPAGALRFRARITPGPAELV